MVKLSNYFLWMQEIHLSGFMEDTLFVYVTVTRLTAFFPGQPG